jgi:hypothetical protein
MPKLVSHEDGVLVYEVLQHWERDGHEVALMRLSNKEAPDCTGSHLLCECDFDVEDYVVDGKVVGKTRKNDPHKCEAKKLVRETVMRKARRQGYILWQGLGLKEAVLDIHRRAKAGEYFGQHEGAYIYTQEVASLLGRGDEEVLAACGELYAEERLDLNGRILTDFVPGFRFPREMVDILRYIVEEPLGWPNGDAGDCYVGGLEREVQAKHGFTSGKQAFGPHWPNINGDVLAELALKPVAETLRFVAPLFPKHPVSEEGIKSLVDEAMEDAPAMRESLPKLAEACPEIAAEAFREFVSALFRLSFERVEIDRQMRTAQVPPSQTLCELADRFDKVAENLRTKAKA